MEKIDLNQMDRAAITTLYNDVTGKGVKKLTDSKAAMYRRVFNAVQAKLPEATLDEGVIALPGYADFDDARYTLTVWDITDPEEVEAQEQAAGPQGAPAESEQKPKQKPKQERERKDKPHFRAAEHSPAKGKNLGVCATIRELLLEGNLETAEIVEQVRAAIPESRCTNKDVSIVRSKLRKEGKLPPKEEQRHAS